MKKILVTFFIIALMLSASLSAVNMVAASSEDDDDAEETTDTEHSHEEEDVEEDVAIGSDEDDEGDLHVSSEDNAIEFESEKPQMHFKYVKNKTEIKFEANDFALIEFVDENNDSKIQSEEIQQKLKFSDIQWNFTYEKTIKDNNTIITVTYYVNSREYEISLVMRVYQRRVTESSTIWNATIIYDVDGGADEVKFDLIVSRWKWVNETSKLALLMELESEVEGKIEMESASIDKDQILIKLDIVQIKVGWVKKAKIVAADGTEKFVNVTVDYKESEFELERSEVELELKVYFVYPHFGENTLIHDPSIRVEDDPLLYIFNLITPEILLGTAITATAIVAAAIAFTRRKRKLQPSESSVPLAL